MKSLESSIKYQLADHPFVVHLPAAESPPASDFLALVSSGSPSSLDHNCGACHCLCRIGNIEVQTAPCVLNTCN